MSDPAIDLVYFEGCPHVDQARENLREALGGGSWQEWNLLSADTPERFHRHGSPTVLVEGRDVTGEKGTTTAMACRADGAPSVEEIQRGLARNG